MGEVRAHFAQSIGRFGGLACTALMESLKDDLFLLRFNNVELWSLSSRRSPSFKSFRSVSKHSAFASIPRLDLVTPPRAHAKICKNKGDSLVKVYQMLVLAYLRF